VALHQGAAVALSAALMAGCAAPVEYAAPALPARDVAPALYVPPVVTAYRLQVGDSLSLRSYFDAQLNQEALVRPDGRISVLLVGDLLAAGLTPEQLAGAVRERYKRVVGDTDVTATLTRSAGMSVYLSGEVRTPSMLPIDGNLTLMQAMARVGGTLVSANTSNVLLIRNQDDGTLLVSKVDMEQILQNRSPDVYLQPRDVIHIPKSQIAQVGQFVDQYINAIVPRAVQLQLGWVTTRVTNENPAVQVTAP